MTFKSGESGNPNGRPKGTGHRQRLFNATVKPHQEALIAKAIELALNGNEAMLKLFLDRLLPVKSLTDSLDSELSGCLDFKNATDIAHTGEMILQALATNQITLSEAKTLMNILEIQGKNLETLKIKDDIGGRKNVVPELIAQYRQEY